MLDDAASVLDQLGAVGTGLAPQMLSAWKDAVTNRRRMLRLLDPAAADPAGHARADTVTVADLEQFAERYQALHATADPAALLTPVVAHVRMATAALSREHTAAERRRLLRNLATVATLAGRLAYEDLGDAPSGRAYYGVAVDSAREADDQQSAATILGYTAQLDQRRETSHSVLMCRDAARMRRPAASRAVCVRSGRTSAIGRYRTKGGTFSRFDVLGERNPVVEDGFDGQRAAGARSVRLPTSSIEPVYGLSPDVQVANLRHGTTTLQLERASLSIRVSGQHLHPRLRRLPSWAGFSGRAGSSA